MSFSKGSNVLLGKWQNLRSINVQFYILSAAGLWKCGIVALRSFHKFVWAVVEQLEVILEYLVKTFDLRLRKFGVMSHHRVVGILRPPRVLMLGLNYTSQTRFINQIFLVVVERFKFRNNVELHLTRRTKVGDWRPVHVERSAGLSFKEQIFDELGKGRPPRSKLSLLQMLI